MNYLEGEKSEVFESHKAKVIENINKSKSMGMNKITAILAIDDEDEIIQGALINWLIKEGYRISLIKEDYNILVIEWVSPLAISFTISFSFRVKFNNSSLF